MEDLQNQIIEELIGLIEPELVLLRSKQEVSFEGYLSDVELQHIAERALQNAIQACIGIGARIISKMSFRKAEGYHDIFDILSQQKIIPADLRDRMHEMVGLRNALVHEYRVIEHSEVYSHFQGSLNVLEEFVRKIAQSL
jgi:uncharacterized protein YutE (UPF0331/DUF86 family)